MVPYIRGNILMYKQITALGWAYKLSKHNKKRIWHAYVMSAEGVFKSLYIHIYQPSFPYL